MAASPAALRTAVLSTVHRGTAFEERSRRLLQTNLSMSLRRVGGASDGGIDLQGWWWLPPPSSHPSASRTPSTSSASASASASAMGVLYTPEGGARRRIRVIAQCKAETKKMGPNYVREMEGVLHTLNLHGLQQQRRPHPTNTPSTQESERWEMEMQTPTVALLVSQSNFTRSTLLRAMSSPLPFMLMYLPPLSFTPGGQGSGSGSGSELEGDGQIGTAMWNAALGGENGVLRGEGELRWERGGKAGDVGRPGLWWGGKKLRNWVPPETQFEEGSEEEEELELG